MIDPKAPSESLPAQPNRSGAPRAGGTAILTDTDVALHKPAWLYGMELMPAHFQHQLRYFERLVDAAVRSSFDVTWGVSELTLDPELLAAGQVSIERLVATLPDGTPVVVGGRNANARIASRSFESELRAKGAVDVYVGLLTEQYDEGNVAESGQEPRRARFITAKSIVRDFNTGEDPFELEWLCGNLRLLSDAESREDYSCIRIARLERTKAGTIAMASDFAPPVLRVSGAPVLVQAVSGVRAALQTARAALLSQHGTGRGANVPDGLRGFVLSTIGQLLPRLTHALTSPNVDPIEAFTTLAEVVGALSAYAPSGGSTMPTHNHADPAPGFLALAAEARRVLFWVGAPPYRAIPVTRADSGIWTAAVSEAAIFSKDFVVVITGGEPNHLRNEVAHLARVAPVDEIARVIQAAVPGVRLVPETQRIQGIPLAANSACFRFDKSAPMWRSIVSKGTIAFQLPPSIAATAEVALFVEAAAQS